MTASLLELDAETVGLFRAHTGVVAYPTLGELYTTWMTMCPYDTIRKYLAADGTLPGSDPSVSVRRATSDAAGFTCMSGAVAFAALLRAHGLAPVIVGCSVEADAAALAPGHGAVAGTGTIAHLGVRVTDDEGTWWLDTAVNHVRPLRIAGDMIHDPFPACVGDGVFARRSMTSNAELRYRFIEDIDDQDRIDELIEATRSTIDPTSPVYAVRARPTSWAARGGPGGWQTLEIDSGRPWEDSTFDSVVARLGLSVGLVGALRERCQPVADCNRTAHLHHRVRTVRS